MSDKKEIYVDPRHEENSFNLPFWRDNKKLWALDIPVEYMNIDELLWMFEIPFWEDKDGNIVITPSQVIENPNNYPIHKAKLEKCDTSYPIDIMINPKGKWMTLDGLHRLVKQVMQGKTVVKVRKTPREIIHLTKKD